jgi:predicted adenine nucleotide alpha hydrolase (AANH) superfamily ATPase
MKLLLHCCCGPCTTSVADYYRSREEGVVAWFCNPNLLPEERARRHEAFARTAEAMGLETRPAEETLDFLDLLLAIARGRGSRCEACYELRLEAAARKAVEEGCDGFATTLTISPYQDLEALRRIGKEVGARYGVEFVFTDLRDHYPESRKRARELGLYLQKYCGCVFSALERAEGRAGRMMKG